MTVSAWKVRMTSLRLRPDAEQSRRGKTKRGRRLDDGPENDIGLVLVLLITLAVQQGLPTQYARLFSAIATVFERHRKVPRKVEWTE